jgi:hypothetical protein
MRLLTCTQDLFSHENIMHCVSLPGQPSLHHWNSAAQVLLQAAPRGPPSACPNLCAQQPHDAGSCPPPPHRKPACHTCRDFTAEFLRMIWSHMPPMLPFPHKYRFQCTRCACFQMIVPHMSQLSAGCFPLSTDDGECMCITAPRHIHHMNAHLFSLILHACV